MMIKTLSFLMIGALGFVTLSCSRLPETRVVSSQTAGSAVVYEATGSFSAVNKYTLIFDFPYQLNYADVVFIYRKKMVDNGLTVWESIPRTIYLEGGKLELDYDFDFTVSDAKLFVRGNYDISTTPEYLNNQTFRMVVVPVATGKRKIDYRNYNEVIKLYNIQEKDVEKL